jgi:hypothetical protein
VGMRAIKSSSNDSGKRRVTTNVGIGKRATNARS